MRTKFSFRSKLSTIDALVELTETSHEKTTFDPSFFLD